MNGVSTIGSVGERINWTQFWQTYKQHAQWDLEWYDGSKWKSIKDDLDAQLSYPEPNKCKVNLVFDASHAGNYRLTHVISKTVREHISRVDKWQYELHYEGIRLTFDWSDCKDISGLQFTHGVKNDMFWFRIRRDNVPLGAHVEIDPSTVGTTTATFGGATNYGYQRKSFYAGGRFWAFYVTGGNAGWRTSTDGATWGGFTSIGACRWAEGPSFSVWFDGTYVHYARHNTTQDLLYRRGVPNSNGTITWSAVEQTIHNGSSTDEYEYPCIAVDTNGYAWIGAYYDKPDGTDYPVVMKNANNNGTWSTHFVTTLSTSFDTNRWRVSVIPLTSGKVYVIYCNDAQPPWGNLWNGSSWTGEESNLADYNIRFAFMHSAVAYGDDVHLVYLKEATGEVRHNKRTYGVGWDTNDVLVQDTDTYCSPALSIDSATGDLYCFWAQDTDHVYYEQYTSGAWQGAVDWIDESADGMESYQRLSSFYMDYSDYVGLLYSTKTASPYNVRFAFFRIPTYIEIFTETLALNDIRERLFSAQMQFAEMTSLVDAYERVLTLHRTLAETTTLFDSVLKGPQRTLSDAIDITSHTALDVVLTLSRPGESISLADTISKMKTSFRIFAETATLVSSIIKGITRSPFAETLTPADSIIKDVAKSPLETITLNESGFGIIQDFDATLSEIGTLPAALDMIITLPRPGESISLTGSIIKDAAKPLAETLTLADSIIKNITKSPLMEIITPSDTLLRQSALQRILTDNMDITSHTVLDIILTLLKPGESFSLTDSMIRQLVAYKSLSESVALSDTHKRLLSLQRQFTEAASLSDVCERFRLVLRTLYEKAGLVAPDPSCILRLDFDENRGNIVKDTSGLGNDGTIYGASWVDGEYGKALSFDPVNDYVHIPNFTIPDDHTIAFTITLPYVAAGSWRRILNCVNGTDRAPGIWAHITYPQRLHWKYNPGNLGFSAVGPGGEGTDFVVDTLYRIIGVKEGTTLKLYVGGNYVATVNVPEIITPGTYLRFGNPSVPRNMILDNVLIYNRIFTSSDVKTHYEQRETKYLSKSITKSPFVETLTLVDSIIKSVARSLAESVSLGDTYSKFWIDYKSLNESISLAGSLIRQTSLYRIYSETTSLIDAMSKMISQKFVEMLIVSDVGGNFAENPSLEDPWYLVNDTDENHEINRPDKWTVSYNYANSNKLLTLEENIIVKEGQSAIRLEYLMVGDDFTGSLNVNNGINRVDVDENRYLEGGNFQKGIVGPASYVDQTFLFYDKNGQYLCRRWAYTITGINEDAEDGWRLLSSIWQPSYLDPNLPTDSGHIPYIPKGATTAYFMQYFVWRGGPTEREAIFDKFFIYQWTGMPTDEQRIDRATTIWDVQRIWTIFRTYAESLSLSDTVTKNIGQKLIESVTLTDTFERVTTIHRVLTDATTLADSVIKNIAKFPLVETLTLTDSVSKIKASFKNFTETIALADTYLKIWSTHRILTEMVTLSDTFLRELVLYKSLTDSIDITSHSTLDIILTLLKPGESTSLIDTILKVPEKILAETTILSDNLLRILALQRILADTMTLADTVVAIKFFIKRLTETLILSDTFSHILDLQRILTDTMTLSDNVLRQLATYRILTEAVALSDAHERLLSIQRLLAETASLGDTYVRLMNWYRENLETIKLIPPLLMGGAFEGGEDLLLYSESASWGTYNISEVANPGRTSYVLRQRTGEYEMFGNIVQPNTNYVMSCWVGYTADWDGGSQIFHTRYWDGAGNPTTGGSGTLIKTEDVDGITWEYRYLSFKTNADANGNISWYLGYSAGGTTGWRYLTDVKLEEGLTYPSIDYFSKIWSISREKSETLVLSDLGVITIQNFVAILSEIVALSDTYSKIWNAYKRLTETTSLQGSLIRQISLYQIYSETASLSDTFLRGLTLYKILTDSIDITSHSVLDMVLTLLRSGETISLTDTIFKEPQKFISETVTLSDNLSRMLVFQRTLTDTVTLSDTATVIKIFIKTLTETLTLSDALLRMLTLKRVLTEISSLSDILLRQISLYQTLTEVPSLSDSLLKDVGKNLTEATTLSDSLLRTLTLQRTLTETVPLSDRVLKGLEKTLSDILILSDMLQYQLILYKALTEAFSLSDTFIQLINFYRIFTETVTISDTFLRTLTFQRLLIETTTMSDIFLRMLTLQRILTDSIDITSHTTLDIILTLPKPSESISLIDSILKGSKRTLAETTTLSDTLQRQLTLYRALMESVTLSDIIIATKYFIKTLTETVTLSDALLRILTLQRILAETTTLSDTLQRQLTLYRILTDSIDITSHTALDMIVTLLRPGESVSLVDTILKGPERILSETATLSDNLSRILALQRILTDIITLSDTATAIKFFVKMLMENITLSDTLLRQLALQRILAETITLNDLGVSIVQHFAAILSEVLTLSDSVFKDLGTNLAETITLSDSLLRTLTLQRILEEVTTMSDILMRQLSLYKILAETATLSDALSYLPVLYKILTESIDITSHTTLDMILTLLKPGELISLTDTVLKEPRKILSEIVALSDSILKRSEKIISETVTLLDNLSHILPLQRILTETMTLSDSILKQLVAYRELTETTTLLDSILKGLQKTLSDAVDITSHTTLDIIVTLPRPGEEFSLTDSIIKGISKMPFIETITLTAVMIQDIIKIFMETLTLTDSVIKSVTKSFVETLTLTDSVIKGIPKLFIETITLSDTFLRGSALQRTLVDSIDITSHTMLDMVITLLKPGETISLTDFIIKDISKTAFIETITLADAMIKDMRKLFAETLTLTDSMIKSMPKLFVETLALTDSVIKSVAKPFMETITLSDVFLRPLTLYRILTDSIDITSHTALDIILTLPRPGESISLTDTVLKDSYKKLLETITISDVLIRQPALYKVLSETIAISDAFLVALIFQRILMENIATSDMLMRQLVLYRTLAETTTLFDNILKESQKILSEAVTLSDTLMRQLALYRVLAEATTISDIMSPQWVLQKILTETIILSDTLMIQQSLYKILTDMVALSDIVASIKVIIRVLTETFLLSDSMLKMPERILSEIAILSDVLQRQLALQRTLTEATALYDTLLRQSSLQRILTETIALSDTFLRTLSLQRILIDNITLDDTFMRQLDLYRALTETTTISDAYLHIWDIYRTLTEIIALSDNLTRQQTLYRILMETIVSDDVLLRILTLQKILMENITTSDTWTRQLALYRSLTEAITLSDFISKGISTTFAETVTIDDTLIRLINFYRTITEAVTVSDILLRQSALQRILSEVATLSDKVLKEPQRILMEVVTLSDLIDRVMNKMIVETATMSDTLLIGRSIIFRTFTETILLWDIIHGVGKNIVLTTELSLMAKKMILDVAEKSHELSLLMKETTMDVLRKTYELNLLTKKTIIGVFEKNQEIYFPTKKAIMDLIKRRG